MDAPETEEGHTSPTAGSDPESGSQQSQPVDLRDYVRFDQREPVRVRVFATDVLTVNLWCLEPRQRVPNLKLHDSDLAYTVLAGQAWFATGDGEVGLGPLGSLLVPAGIQHSIANNAPDPLVVAAHASPPEIVGDVTDVPIASEAAAVVAAPAPGTVRTRIRRVLGGRRD